MSERSFFVKSIVLNVKYICKFNMKILYNKVCKVLYGNVCFFDRSIKVVVMYLWRSHIAIYTVYQRYKDLIFITTDKSILLKNISIFHYVQMPSSLRYVVCLKYTDHEIRYTVGCN